MELYTGVLLFLGIIVWLVIGIYTAGTFHWCFGIPHAPAWKQNTLFIFNVVFWPWLYCYQLYGIILALCGR